MKSLSRLFAFALPWLSVLSPVHAEPIGLRGPAGCLENPKRVQRLTIDTPGVYENLLVDGDWSDGNLVKIRGDNITLRNCEIRHGRHNGIVVTGQNVVIESCQIHHLLAGTFRDQQDAHGITGHPRNLVIRNCEISYVSGDCLQFDPGRGVWDDVLVENCEMSTGPLHSNQAGFRRGERPGENAIDTKQRVTNPRSKLVVRNSFFHGWQQPGQVSNLAALNLKNHVEVRVENCLFWDNEICLRLRGGTGDYGGAHVTADRCAFFDSAVAVRVEDRIESLRLHAMKMGRGIQRQLVAAGGGAALPHEIRVEPTSRSRESTQRTGVDSAMKQPAP